MDEGGQSQWASRPINATRTLIDLSGLQDALEELAKRSNDQEVLGRKTEVQIQMKADAQMLDAVRQNVQSQIHSLEKQLKEVREKVALVPRSEVKESFVASESIGLVVSWMMNRLQTVETELHQKASNIQVEKAISINANTIVELDKKICFEKASAKELDRLKDNQQGLVQQIKAIQELLHTKLDRLEMSYLEDMVDKIKSFAKYHESITAELETSKRRLQQVENENADIKGRLSQLEVKFQSVAKTLPQTASIKDLENLAALVVNLQQSTEDFASRNDLVILSEKVKKQNHQISSISNGLLDLQGFRETATKQRQASEVDISNSLRKLATIEYCDQKLNTLSQKLNKVDSELTSLSQLRETVKDSELRQTNLAQQVDLALRFVEWFSDRGQAYEHNLHSVEENLAKLTKDSLTTAALPFRRRVTGRPPSSSFSQPPPAE